MSAPTIAPKDAGLIRAAQRLRATINSEGWPDVLKILDAIVADALQKVEEYPGTDEKHIATLSFSWKTTKAVRENFKATVAGLIKEGDDAAQQYRKPQDPKPSTEESPIESATVVKPLCDVTETKDAGTEQSDSSSPDTGRD